jgi:Tfp pilus assembly protein PilV
MTRIERGRAAAGFTILEVLVAVFLMLVGVGATAQLIVTATGQAAAAQQSSIAGTLAAQTVESYRDRNFGNIAPGTFVSTSTVGATAFTITTVVTVNDPQPNMDRVHVTVSWAGGGQSYVTETILAPLG